MQIIQGIREKGAAIVIAIIALSLIGFILMDAKQQGNQIFGSRSQNIGKVNGSAITYTEFKKKTEFLELQEEQQSGKKPNGSRLAAIRDSLPPKSLIILGGRNVFPEDIERVVGAIDGVRPGNVIAFGVEGYKGKESVVVVAEVRTEDPATVRDAIHHRTLDVCGLPPRDVMLVKAGTLPKTSSGKLQRAKCRELYLDEQLELA